MNITNALPKKARPYAKAIFTLAVVLASSLLLVVEGGVTLEEWLQVVIATAAGGGTTYSVRNGDAALDGGHDAAP